ncbi:MAG: hypothetical protein WAO35_17415 [Terriglobia bacterium]
MVKPLAKNAIRVLGVLTLLMGVIPNPLAAQRPAAAQLPPRVDPQAGQLLNRTIQVLGGQAFLAAKSLTSRGRVFFFQEGRTAGMEPFVSQVVYPDKRRIVIAKNKKNISMDTGNVTYEGETKPIIFINNGDKGWELDQMGLIVQGDQQLNGWILSNRYSLENLLRLRINEPGVLIQMGAVDFVDNTATEGIEIIASGGTSVRLDLGHDTFIPSRITYRVRNVKEDAWDEYSDAYSDYKTFDGILTPMHITRYLNGDRIGETFRNFAKYNEEYPPNIFTPE